MISISKNVFIDKLDDIVDKYNTYCSTIKMKPVDVKSNTYINASKEINNEDPKFKIGDIAGISKYKNVFAKGYVLNWSSEVSVITALAICNSKRQLPSYLLSTLSTQTTNFCHRCFSIHIIFFINRYGLLLSQIKMEK